MYLIVYATKGYLCMNFYVRRKSRLISTLSNVVAV